MKSRLKMIVGLATVACLAAGSLSCGAGGGKVSQDLIGRLEADSQISVEPWNSKAFEEAMGRGAAVVPDLLRSVQAGSAKAVLSLEALRRIDNARYAALAPRDRAKIYADALGKAKQFNLWGLPGFHWEEPAKAFIGLDKDGVTATIALLDDKHPALMWGSKESTTAADYQNRICDYAFALINEMLGRAYEYKKTPVERDQLIRDLKSWLDANRNQWS